MAKVIVIANQKGGVAKTSTATSLAAAFNDMGHPTLLIDADKQGNSSSTYRAVIDGAPTLSDVIVESPKHTVNINDAIQGEPCRQIIASDPNLFEAEFKYSQNIKEMYRLKDALSNLDKKWEYVIIDTNPDLNKLLTACLLAADDMIIPVTPDKFAIDGLKDLVSSVEDLKSAFKDANINVKGILITRCPNGRRLLKDEVLSGIGPFAEELNTKVFDTIIHVNEPIAQAQSAGMTVIDYKPKSPVAQEYIQFAKEYLGENQ